MQWRPLSAPIADLLARPSWTAVAHQTLAAPGFVSAGFHPLAYGPSGLAVSPTNATH